MARLEAGLAKTSRNNRTMFRPCWATNQPTTEVTRETLVRTARQLFADRGYAAVGTEEVVQLHRIGADRLLAIVDRDDPPASADGDGPIARARRRGERARGRVDELPVIAGEATGSVMASFSAPFCITTAWSPPTSEIVQVL